MLSNDGERGKERGATRVAPLREFQELAITRAES
jgi:hypothetical protein